MRLSRRQPPEDPPEGGAAAPDGPAAAPPGPDARTPADGRTASAAANRVPAASGAAGPAVLAAELVVDDELEPRIRMPTDLLRCVTAGIEIALLIGIGFLGNATAKAFERDVVSASKHIARGLASPLHSLAFIALLALPVALGVLLIRMSQFRRLAEALVIGLIAAGLTIACNAILTLPGLADVYRALIWSTHPGLNVFDSYLAGLAAYLTVIGLAGRPKWRTWFWLAITFYCVTSLMLPHTATVLSLLLSLLIGEAVGAGLRYVIGTTSDRPTAAEIAAALSQASAPLVRDPPGARRRGREPPLRGGHQGRQPARRDGVRPRSADGRRAVPDLPAGPGQQPGAAQRRRSP